MSNSKKVEMKFTAEADNLFINEIIDFAIQQLDTEDQIDDINEIVKAMTVLSEKIILNQPDDSEEIKGKCSFKENTLFISLNGVESENVKANSEVLKSLNHKLDSVKYNETKNELLLEKYLYIEDDDFEDELSSALDDIDGQTSFQSMDNIDDSLMGLSGKQMEKALLKLKSFDNQKIYFFERNLNEYNSQFILSNLTNWQRVIKGQLVAATLLPLVKSKAFRAITIKDNIGLDRKRTRLYALVNGRVHWDGDVVYINSIKQIKGTVEGSAAAINSKETLYIAGSVKDTSIKVEGDLYVLGSVDNSEIISSGDMYIKQGINNCKNTKVCCGGNLITYEVNSSNLNAQGNVIVTNTIIDSDITAGDNIIMDGSDSIVEKSKLSALQGITVINAGDKKNNEVSLIVKPKVSKNVDIVKTKKEIETIKNSLKKIEHHYKILSEKRLTGDKEAEQEIKIVNNKKMKMEKELAVLNNDYREAVESKKDNTEMRVNIKGKIYKNIIVSINKDTIRTEEEYENLSYINESGKIRRHRPGKAMIDIDKRIINVGQKIKPLRKQVDSDKLRKSLVFIGEDEENALKQALEFLQLEAEQVVYEIIEEQEEFCRIFVLEIYESDNKDKMQKMIKSFKVKEKKPGATKKVLKTVKVKSKNLKKALDLISKKYNIEVNDIKYKIIQQPKSGFAGVGSKDCIIEAEIKC